MGNTFLTYLQQNLPWLDIREQIAMGARRRKRRKKKRDRDLRLKEYGTNKVAKPNLTENTIGLLGGLWGGTAYRGWRAFKRARRKKRREKKK